MLWSAYIMVMINFAVDDDATFVSLDPYADLLSPPRKDQCCRIGSILSVQKFTAKLYCICGILNRMQYRLTVSFGTLTIILMFRICNTKDYWFDLERAIRTTLCFITCELQS